MIRRNMRLIIAGSRYLEDYNVVKNAVNATLEKTEIDVEDIEYVVSGGARGVDKSGEQWAEEHGIPIKRFKVTNKDWLTKGRRAGPERNRKMVEFAKAGEGGSMLVAVSLVGYENRGTKNITELAEEHLLYPIAKVEVAKVGR